MSETRENFSGKTGFILAAAASAVGLGNIWRFPTVAAEHGGGTFLIVYILVTLFFGTMLMITEVALGRHTRKSALHAYGQLDKRGKLIGIVSTIIPVMIMPYYCVVGGWVVGYFAAACMGTDMTAASAFGDFTGSWLAVLAFLAFVAISFYVLYRGVSKGIETVNKIFMPALLIMLVCLTVYMLIQPGIGEGLGAYLGFDWGKLNGELILAAIGQSFYSLSLAMGIMIAYGSYMKKDTDIERTVMSIGVIDILVAFLAGLFIVPAVFNGGSVAGGPGLIFQTLPNIFAGIPFGEVIAVLFYAIVLIAAATSAISIGETIIASLRDVLNISRTRSLAITALFTTIAGTLVCLGFGPLSGMKIFGMGAFDILDFLTNSVLMPLTAIGMCIFVGHIIGNKVIQDEVKESSEFKTMRIHSVMIKWVCPIALSLILLSGLGII